MTPIRDDAPQSLSAICRAAQRIDRHWYRREQLGWLRTLVADYRRLRKLEDDPDPSATAEMLHRVRDLHDELEAELPPEPKWAMMPEPKYQ
ncbi:MAG: hypothetical protein K2X38_12935 [Gemmataceae bacterium]|nr:hypothetical protein [Gemmataceae bacterium]